MVADITNKGKYCKSQSIGPLSGRPFSAPPDLYLHDSRSTTVVPILDPDPKQASLQKVLSGQYLRPEAAIIRTVGGGS